MVKAMSMKIVPINDPCTMVLEAANRIWNEIEATVQYDEELERDKHEWATAKTEDGGDIILLNPYLSVLDTAAALAEAITRLKVGDDVDVEDELYLEMLDKLIHMYTNVDSKRPYMH